MKLRSIATALLALAAFALATSVGCKPAVRGRCNTTRDCRQNSYCAVSGICLASSGTCAPACGEGEICSGSVCALLMPVVSVLVPPGPISPAFPQITVHVEAAVGIALHGIALEVDNSLRALASGALGAPSAGDNLVTLSKFEPNAVGGVTVRATLRFQLPGAAAEESISSVAVPAFIDAVPPTVTVFVPAAADGSSVNGWVSRIGLPLDVRATVDDGAGSGAQSATLSFDTCPATVECVYTGTAISQSGGATVFSFTVPRTAQSAGSEAPLAVTVKAQDVAGNKAQGAGTVQIDDAPPQIGATVLVSTAGVVGEDGNIWFIGGAGARDVEISVPVADSGVGLSSLTLHLTDVAGPDPTPLPQADGTVHFMLPASRVVGREGGLHFTLKATDLVQNSATTPPNNIWVDDMPPTVTLAKVDYANALPTSVCATDLVNTSNCGRHGGTSLLRDDVATVSFDVTDCGSGVVPVSQISLTTTSGGVSKTSPVVAKNPSTPSCPNGNSVHHYAISLHFGDQAPVLDTANANGIVVVRLVANGLDRLGHAVHAAPVLTSGDGTAQVSLWRWRRPMTANPRGSPALLSGNAGARPVVVATDAPSGNVNLMALAADGSVVYTAAVSPGISAEIAVDSQDAVYAVYALNTTSTFNIIRKPPSPSTSAVPDNPACAGTNTAFFNPPAIANISGKDVAVVASSSHTLNGGNIFLFQDQSGACAELGVPQTLPVGGDFAGVTLAPGMAFLAEARGFSSVNQNSTGNGFDAASVVTYNTTPTSTTPPPSGAPPSLTNGSAIFGTLSPDQSVRRATEVCSPAPCTSWQTATGFTAVQASANLSFTPVFDATNIWTVDDKGLVYALSKDKGTLAPGFPVTLTQKAASPVLLQAGALLVQQDGNVTLVSPQGSAFTIWSVPSPSGAPVAPAVDTLTTVGGIAYLPTPSFVYALHVPSAPLAAGSAVWPRPGRDSCNSRNAASSCQ